MVERNPFAAGGSVTPFFCANDFLTNEDPMTQINAGERQRAKAAAANAAVAANDTAVVLGAAGAGVALAGVASGVGALAGVGVGAALAVCSFGAWWMGNRYQRLANDPPRNDFDQFLESSSFVNDNAVPVDEPAATAARYAAQHVVLADALPRTALGKVKREELKRLARHEHVAGPA